MLGLKAIEPDLHKRLTGMDNKPVHEFARRLAARKHPVWIRFVVVPGWTDNVDEIGRMADFAASLGNVATRRRFALSPNGPVQVGKAWNGIPNARCRTANEGKSGRGDRTLPSRRIEYRLNGQMESGGRIED